MFIDIDYNKRPRSINLYLSKPNKFIVSHIHEKYNVNLTEKLGNISELNFTIPYYIESNGEMIKNKHIDLIEEKMLIKATLDGKVEWFIIDSIDENGEDDVSSFSVVAFSLGFELSHKRIGTIQEDSISCRDLLNIILKDTAWRVRNIDTDIEALFRAIEVSDTNSLESSLETIESFDAIINWDTEARMIDVKKKKAITQFKGLTLNYGKLLQSINRSRTTDEMTTRLYVYGNEELGIEQVNPTGMPYIEDFSYFMHPFKRDENKNVLSSSRFMTDELCHSILNQKEALEMNSATIKTLYSNQLTLTAERIQMQVDLAQLRLELTNIMNLVDLANSTGNEELRDEKIEEAEDKEVEISNKETELENKTTQLEGVISQIETIQSEIREASGFTPDLLDELAFYVIEKEWRDDRYLNAQELYDDGMSKFIEIREPKTIITVEVENFLEIIEEQYNWGKLILGDRIRVKYPEMGIEFMAKIVQIDYDFEDGQINITIANTEKLQSEMDRLRDILHSSQSASSLLQNNKYKWDKIGKMETEIEQLMGTQFDANKIKIVAGINNKIEIGNRGIIIKNPDNLNEYLVAQNGILAITNDGGLTWKHAITANGIVGEQIYGNLGVFARIRADQIILDGGGRIGDDLIEGAETWNNAVQKDASYNSTYITSDGIVVKDSNNVNTVQLGEYADGKYGLRVLGANGEVIVGNDGILQTWQEGEEDNADANNPVELDLYVPDSMISIKQALLRFKRKEFRNYYMDYTIIGETMASSADITLIGYGDNYRIVQTPHSHRLILDTRSVLGIFHGSGGTTVSVKVKINGVDRTLALGGTGGNFTSDMNSINIASYLSKGWNKIEIIPNGQTRISGKVFIQCLMSTS